MLLLFALDYWTGDKFRLHALYVLPLAAITLHCSRRAMIWFAFVLSAGCQIITFLSYHLPTPSLLMDIAVAWVSSALTIYLASTARRLHLRLLDQATTDTLTELFNRRHFEWVLGMQIERQRRYGGVFSLAVLDLDGFKLVNDSRGHRVGDDALRLLSRVLRDSTRAPDSVARIGGDEFAVLMPDTDAVQCAAFCRKLTGSIAKRMHDTGLAITASIGFEAFDRSPPDALRALQMADEAMYSVKALGRRSAPSSQYRPCGTLS